MGLKLKIIANPSSGRETAKTSVEDMLSYLVTQKALTRADIYYTAGKDDAKNFAKETNPQDYDYLIAVGGDGTVNEVVSGLCTGKVDIPLAIYTSGTVNDFSTTIGMPQSPSDFARMLMDPDFRRVDCGKCGNDYFLNVAAAGMLTDVAYSVSSELKTAIGPVAYWLSAVKDLAMINNTIPLTVKHDGEEIDVDALMFFVSNTRSVGGFRKLMTLADIEDGLLDMLIVKKIEGVDIVPLLGKLLIGDHLDSSKVIYFQSDNIEIGLRDHSKDIVLDLDGEKGPNLPVTLECIKKCINLIIPKEDM